jgi:ribosome production factor 2
MSTKLAKTQRSKRAMAEKAPKVIENTKSLLGLKGPKASEMVQSVLRDLHKFKSPDSKLLTKINMTRPFEDVSSIEFLGKVNDASLFSYGSHSKKRPHNLVLGRMFDHQLLDMFEFGLDDKTFQTMDAFDGIRKAVVRVGSKPVILFQGDVWDANTDLVVLKNFLLDFFRGETMEKINLSALDRVIIFTATQTEGSTPRIHFRHYGVSLKKSSSTLPRVELDEVGPRMDLHLRRRKSASDEVSNAARKQARQTTKVIFQKNRERDAMGNAVARVHMQRQDFSNLSIARLQGLKKRKRSSEDGAADADGVTDTGAATPDDDGMTDVGEAPKKRAAARPASARPASASSSGAPAAKRLMTGVSHNSMDEFSSRSSVGTASSSGRRESQTDKNLTKKKAAGYGSKPVEGGFKDLSRKKKEKK